MRELRFEGLSEDGTRLVLVGKDGQRWSVVIDERVEAAVRRDRARLGQVEIEQSGELRPREIQARIRAGATAEDVAAASGLPLERIRRFEGPVLTERAWIAQQAGKVQMRRASGDVTLAELVSERLIDQGVGGEDITWDAYRPDDGPWLVIATFPLGPNTHVATWRYDTATRTVAPVDDNAEDLCMLPAPVKLRLVASRPQLTAVTSSPAADHPQAADQPQAADHPQAPKQGREQDNSTASSEIGGQPRYRPQPEEGSGLGAQASDAVAPTELTSQPADSAPQEQSEEPEMPHIGLPQLHQVESACDQAGDSQATALESDSGPRPTPRTLRRNGKRVNRHPSGSQLPAPAPHTAAAELPPTRPEPPAPPTPSTDETAQETAPEPVVKAKPGRTAVPSFDDILFGPAPKH